MQSDRSAIATGACTDQRRGGLLLLRSRRLAAYGLALLLVAVFPDNVYMAVAHGRFPGMMGEPWVQWLGHLCKSH